MPPRTPRVSEPSGLKKARPKAPNAQPDPNVKLGRHGRIGGTAARVIPTPALAALIGPGPMLPTEAHMRMFSYVDKNSLQSTADRRLIDCDPPMETLFGRRSVSLFELNDLVDEHLTPS